MRVVPHSVAQRGVKPVLRIRPCAHPFTVLLMFNMASGFARKNPLAAIKAFRTAFGNDPSTRLIVKMTNATVYPTGIRLINECVGDADNIDVVSRTMSDAEINDLYGETDVVISLHRSEGFGLTVAEAMLRGLPAVATNWSGNVDFLTASTGVPVPYRLAPAVDPQGSYHFPAMSWADADVEAAAAALARLRHDTEWADKIRSVAAAYAAEAWSTRAYVATVSRHLGL